MPTTTAEPTVISPDYRLDMTWVGELHEMGFCLDQWQLNAVCSSAFIAGFTAPRQQGKTYAALARGLRDAMHGKRVVYSPVSAIAARQAQSMAEDMVAGIGCSGQLARVTRSHGSQRIEFVSGGVITFVTRGRTGGRGIIADLFIVDDAQLLDMDTYMSVLLAVTASKDSQLLLLGTAPYPDERARLDAGGFIKVREQALIGDSHASWIEWSAPGARDEHGHLRDRDGLGELLVDPADPALIRQANPGIPARISMRQIERERAVMNVQSYFVERLNAGDWRPVADATR